MFPLGGYQTPLVGAKRCRFVGQVFPVERQRKVDAKRWVVNFTSGAWRVHWNGTGCPCCNVFTHAITGCVYCRDQLG